MMPLTPTSGTPLADAWGVYFNMLRPDGASLQCTVTRGMLDELGQSKGETTVAQQLEIFNDCGLAPVSWRGEDFHSRYLI